MAYVNCDAIVSTQWLADHLDDADLRVVDASCYMKNAKRNPRSEFQQQHIPGAFFFDVAAVIDDASSLPNMLPGPEKFSRAMVKLGIGNRHRIIIYDANGGYMAAHRLWWMCRFFGHENVAVLDGGIGKWIVEERPIANRSVRPDSCQFNPQVNNSLLRSRNQLLENLKTNSEQVIDARPSGRFNGRTPDPRKSLRLGHIPGSCNIPFLNILNMQSHASMRSANELLQIFKEAGLDFSKPTIVSCGYGVMAPCIAFALYLIGKENVSVYDGSWSEWGADHECPVEI